jgi:hypothetical protein
MIPRVTAACPHHVQTSTKMRVMRTNVSAVIQPVWRICYGRKSSYTTLGTYGSGSQGTESEEDMRHAAIVEAMRARGGQPRVATL